MMHLKILIPGKGKCSVERRDRLHKVVTCFTLILLSHSLYAAECELGASISDHWPEKPIQTDKELLSRVMAEYHSGGYDWRRATQRGPYVPSGDYLNFSVAFWDPSTAGPDRVKSDENGVVMVSYDLGETFVYNPVTIAQKALFLHSLYMKGAPLDPLFMNQADHLIRMQGEDGAIRYNFPLQAIQLLEAGWVSGMAQGHAISVWTRAYKLTSNAKYLEASRKAYAFMLRDVKSGGCASTLADLDPSLERFKMLLEYPYFPDAYTLNGSVFSLLGIYDWTEYDPDAMCVFRQFAEPLRYMLPYYDLGGVTSYDLRQIVYKLPATAFPAYQMINLVTVWVLDTILHHPDLEQTWHTWAGYLDQPFLEPVDPVITATALDNGRAVKLSIPADPGGAEIRYTTDGVDPTADSGLLYDPKDPPRWNAAAIVKFGAFRTGSRPSAIISTEIRKLSPPLITQAGSVVGVIASDQAQVKYLRRYPNLLHPETWTVGTFGSQPGFNINGDVRENTVEIDETPYELKDKMWVAYNRDTDASGSADGGWDTAKFPIDNTKTYRYSIWLKKTGGWSAYSHLGSGPLSALTGSNAEKIEALPYFWSGGLPTAEWVLLVGYVRPAGYSGSTSFGKVYSQSGEPLLSGTDFKWLGGTTESNARAYMFYALDLNEKQRFWNPRVELADNTDGPEDVYWAPSLPSGASITLTSPGGALIEAVSCSSDPLLLASAPTIFQVMPPQITITHIGSEVRVQWPNGPDRLHAAENPDGPWEIVADGVSSPYVINATGKARFYRLSK
jgi:heparosan-N-sulfate-glucuronate 5-epimerase